MRRRMTLHPMAQELLQHLLERQGTRPAVHQGQQNDAGGSLQRRVFVELVEDEVGILAALHIEDQTYWFAVAGAGLVAQSGDALDALFLDQVADGLGQAVARRLIGHLGDDDLAAVALLLNQGPGTQGDLAAAGAVAVDQSLPAADDAPGGKIGPGNDLHQVQQRDAGIVDQGDEAVAHLAQVVRRDVGGHAHGDAVGAVDDQVGELARQHQRFLVFAIVVLNEVDGVGRQVGQHLGGHGRQAGLGVTHGCGRQTGDRAEVSLTQDQPAAHVPVLGHADQGRIDGHVAVRMVPLHGLADDAGAFAGRAGRSQAQVVHGHQDAPLRGLQAIAHIRQGPADDDAHRVGEITILQLIGDIERFGD